MLLLICSCKWSIIFREAGKIDWIRLSFEVLDSSDTSSTISSTLQTSSSTGTTSGTASSSSSSSSSSPRSSSSSSSRTKGLSPTVKRNLAISMGVVAASFAVLLIFFLWRFCIRRKGRNGGKGIDVGNMNQVKPHYQKVSKIPGNGTRASFNDNSDGATNLGIQKCASIIILLPTCSNSFFNSNNLYEPPITFGYDRGSTSSSGVPSTLFTNQSRATTPRTQQGQHDPQKRISALLMATDRPPTYWRNSTLDESAPVSPSSTSSNTNEKSGRSPRISPNTPFKTVAEGEVEFSSTTTPEGREENVSA